MKKILDYLEQLDLSDVEAKLYLSLLQTGPITVRELAETIELKRTTAYLYIDQLIEKGLIMKVVKGSQKLVAANDPKESLEFLVKKKLEKAKAIETDFPTMLQTITTSIPDIKNTGDAEVKYYKGINGVSKIYEEALKAKELRSYFNLALIKEALPDNGQLFTKALKSNTEIKIFELHEDSPLSREKLKESPIINSNHERYFYKFLPKGIHLSAADILIYDGHVAIINVSPQLSGVLLKNTDYHNNSKEFFDLVWKILPETK